MSDYSPRIRAARNYAGLSQRALADALGVDEQTIKRRESPGGKEPKRGERVAIASICGVPAEFMEDGFGEIRRDEILDDLEYLRTKLDDLNVALAVLVEQRQVELTGPPLVGPDESRPATPRRRTTRRDDEPGTPD